MTLSNGFPGHTELATFADVRRDLEGAVVRNAAGVMRAGVFPAHLNPLVTGRSDMRVQIGDFRAVQNRGGAIFLSNAGVDTSVTLDAAPAANKRIDLIYVTQLSTTLGDSSSGTVFGVVKGTASATPVVPSLPAGLADALPLATVEIPAGATTTLSAGVVISQVYPYTATAGGTVVVRNTVELAAWTPADGARAYCLADSGEYVRFGDSWKRAGGPIAAANFTAQSSIVVDGMVGAGGYELVLHVSTSSVINDVKMRLRAGGATKTAANYHRQMLYGSGSTAGASQASGSAYWQLFQANRNVKSARAQFFNLNNAGGTNVIVNSYAHDSPSNPQLTAFGMYHGEAAACDGIELSATTGTITGYYEVWAR